MIKRSSLFAPFHAALALLLRIGRRLGTPWNLYERAGVLPIPIHHYQPYALASELEQSGFWQRRLGSTGIACDIESCLQLLDGLGADFAAECQWPTEPPPTPGYYEGNPAFGYASAIVAHAMVRHFKPRCVIEVGSGYSTHVLGQALARNDAETGSQSDLIAVEPHPGPVLAASIPNLRALHQVRVETLELAFFDRLRAGDMLFIDSSHVLRYGGDVLFLYLDVLPRIAPGVIVHIHDIHWPEPYPKAYFAEHRLVWDEQYLLQAFLTHNSQFEVLLPCWQLHLDHGTRFGGAFPGFDPRRHRPGSSFWMRRRGG